MPGQSPQEIVSAKTRQFAASRRKIVEAMAKQFGIDIPAGVPEFFDAAEAGHYEDLQALFQSLKLQRTDGTNHAQLGRLWPAIVETLGVSEQAHDWPAQRLLDYGHSVLDSLRPGMIYVGGTDSGRFIPTLLNETSEGEQHVIITQNALADNSYLDYIRFLYGDRIPMLADQDSQKAFQDYLTDAQKRLEHDRSFPNDPKQLRPGEDVHIDNNRVAVSGQVAVMAINERLLQSFMEKNPDASFAIEQSFPFTSTYAQAAPLGPIMEIRAQESETAFTTERLSGLVDYWRDTVRQLAGEGQTDSQAVEKTYSKLVSEQASLLLDRKRPVEAEQMMQLAAKICPYSPEVVFRYVNFLVQDKRWGEALALAENGVNADPKNQQFQDLVQSLKSSAHQK
jgi:hypothetical protein